MTSDAIAARISKELARERMRIAEAVVDASAHALNIVDEFDRPNALAVDTDAGYERARSRAFELVQILGTAHGQALALSRDYAQDRTHRQMALALAHKVAHVRGQAKSLVQAVDNERTQQQMARALQALRITGSARALAVAETLAFDGGHPVSPQLIVAAVQSNLVEVVARTQRVAAGLDSPLDSSSTATAGRTAVRLVAVAAEMAPADLRARYSEEYSGELWEIAEVGASHREQLAYASRVLIRAASVRAALWRRRLAGGEP